MEDLKTLCAIALHFIKQIENHPDFKKLEYYPDLTMGDAHQAVDELMSELDYAQKISVVPTPHNALTNIHNRK